MAFPPSKGNQTPKQPVQVTGERGPISTGNGGIKASLRLKAAGTSKPDELKSVNLS